jgi:hypothetical protein
MPLRKLSQEEERFLQFMVDKASLPLPADWKQTIRVKPMDDGGMGSLLLFPDGTEESQDRAFEKTIAEHEFKDADRIDVLASLNVDRSGQLLELDIWKMNFDPLIRFPDLKK